jgi:hypothetical protein
MRIENMVYCVLSINDYVDIILLISLFPVHPSCYLENRRDRSLNFHKAQSSYYFHHFRCKSNNRMFYYFLFISGIILTGTFKLLSFHKVMHPIGME